MSGLIWIQTDTVRISEIILKNQTTKQGKLPRGQRDTELILGFVEKGPTPLCSQKGANLQIKWVMVFFLKKMPTSPSTLKKTKSLKTKSTPKKIEQGLSLGAGLFCSPPNHNNPGLQVLGKDRGREWVNEVQRFISLYF